MNILYAPIFEGGSVHETAVRYKRGLYNALCAYGDVVEFDYLAHDPATVYDGFAERINAFAPDLLISQFHGANVLSPAQIRSLRAIRPSMLWANWAGDSWAHSLTAPPILEMAREFDWQLVAAPDVLPVYAQAGIRAAYWNIAYEPPVEPLPDMPRYDVVWLANVINDRRRALMERLKRMDGVTVGIYGDWEHADGNNVYHFPQGEALYKNATIAIADNVYPEQINYVSNRPMQALAAGGALLLHQRVPKMFALTGWIDGVHYVEWQDADELDSLIRHWLQPERAADRRRIVYAGQRQTLHHHSYAERARALFEDILAIEGIRRVS